MLALFIIITLGAAFLIALFGRRSGRFCEIVAVASCLTLCFLSVCSLLLFKSSGVIVYRMGGWVPPLGICLVLDGLSVFMLVTINLVLFLIAVYSTSYMAKYTDTWKFFCLFMLMVSGMNGIILTGDIFNLFVFLEIASIASYALVAFGVEAEQLEASFKYAVMGSVAAAFILLGIAFLYAYTSTLNMADVAQVITKNKSSMLLLLVGVLFIAGFGIKSAVAPFHSWLPDAHSSAPAPISAMLSGVLIKVLGAYSLARIFFNVLGISEPLFAGLMVFACASIIIGGLLSVGQWDFKRLLAYSSVSQIGYIVLGLSLATPLGVLGALFHLFNHSIFKSLLFLGAGAVEYATGKRDLRALGGLKERMPVTATTSWIASMSISGIPPFNGFWSKLIIIIACVQADKITCACIAVIGSILTFASLMRVQKFAFFGTLNAGLEKVKEVPAVMRFSMIVLSMVCVFGGILLIPYVSGYFVGPAVDALISGQSYATAILQGK